MPRRLKVFRAHLGFYDSVIAAPSQKAALEAWGAGKSEFAHGFAEVTDDPKAVTAALAEPGIVLRRPFGSNGEFKSAPEAPAVPKPAAKRKHSTRQADRERKRKAAAEAKAARAEEKRKAEAAKKELRDIGIEEAKLRDRRKALQKTFKLRRT